MELHLKFLNETKTSTLSELFCDGKSLKIYVLEDGYQKKKVKAITRIPGGVYNVSAATSGRHFADYSVRFGHKFSVLVESVPNFSGIMMHIGNEVAHTEGCLLVGKKRKAPADLETGSFTLQESTVAYKELYALLEPIFYDAKKKKLTGAKVTLHVDRTGSVREGK